MFDDEGALKLDEKISGLVRKITTYIKKSEVSLKEMQAGSAMLSEANEENEESEEEKITKQKKTKKISLVKKEIIMNVQQNYLSKL